MIVYLSGPITAQPGFTVEQHVNTAVAVYFACIRRGINTFCPYCAAYPEAFDIDYERWMAYDLAMIDVCSHVLMLDRWETSKGARIERDYALAQGKTVVYSIEDVR